MDDSEKEWREERGRMIRAARIELGLTQDELAQKVGTTQQSIDKMERGVTKKGGFLPELSRELNIPLERLIPTLQQSSPRATSQVIPREELQGEIKDFPVHAATDGGKGVLIVSTEPIDWVVRPAPLARVKDAYGLVLVGHSMEPAYNAGDTLLIHPHLPALSGHPYVFYAEGDGEARATLKWLLRETDAIWHVLQYNPKREFDLDRNEWGKCHRVVGKYNR